MAFQVTICKLTLDAWSWYWLVPLFDNSRWESDDEISIGKMSLHFPHYMYMYFVLSICLFEVQLFKIVARGYTGLTQADITCNLVALVANNIK